MSNAFAMLEPWVKPGLLSRRHVAGAQVLMELAFGEEAGSRTTSEWFIVALLLKTPEDEHTCLDLSEMDAYEPNRDEEHEWAPLPLSGLEEWRKLVLGMPELVAKVEGATSIDRPLVLAGNRLYLARMFGDEVKVAEKLSRLDGMGRLKILFGGPGSGKTTATAEDLVKLLGDKPHNFKVELAAPTGKAAKRMSQVIQKTVKELKSGSISREAIENATKILSVVKSKTIHKLLKFNPVADDRYRMNEENPLDCDLLIIDECSMISLDMLAHVLLALPARAELWLVGDPDQLASVGAGTVFADLRSAARKGKLKNQKELPGNRRAKDPATRELIGIVQGMSQGANSTKTAVLKAIDDFVDTLKARQQAGVLEWIDTDEPGAAVAVNRLLEEVVSVARERVLFAGQPNAELALAMQFNDPLSILDQQVLCVHHRGMLGVQGVNERVRRALRGKAQQQWFVGRPVLVTRNDSRTGLYNGDTGVVATIGGNRVLLLSDPPDLARPLELTRIDVARVTDHALNYAMTVHKSQGSEYRHVIVMFPQNASRICTREMLYTAISRVRERLTIVGSEKVIRHMLATPIRRATGLAERF